MLGFFPTRKTKPKSRRNPYEKASLYSKFLGSWTSEVIRISNKLSWQQHFNYNLAKVERVQHYKPRMQKVFNRKKKIIPSILSLYKGKLFIFLIMSLISSGLLFALTYNTSSFFSEFSKNKDITNMENMKPLIIYLSIGAVLRTLSDMTQAYFDFYSTRISIIIKASILGMLQDKISKFSTLNSSRYSEGFITNLVQVDSEVTALLMNNIYSMLNAIIGIFVSSFSMAFFVGWEVTAILMGSFLLLNTLNFAIYRFQWVVVGNYLKAKDKRMTFFRNILENIDFIKRKSMENFYTAELFEYREHELGYLKQNAAVQGALTMVTWFAFTIASCAMILYYSFAQVPIQAFSVFTGVSDSLTNAKQAFADFFVVWNYFITFKVSVNRIDDFLNAREIDFEHVKKVNDAKSEDAVVVEEGFFKWRYSKKEEGERVKKRVKGRAKKDIGDYETNDQVSLQSKPLTRNTYEEKLGSDPLIKNVDDSDEKRNLFYLRNINFNIKKGEKVAVIGKSCSGKSSLLYSLLGEMIPVDEASKVTIDGKVSYLSQKRWLIGDTIRENITLGNEYDENLMEKALETSQFLVDLLTLDKGLDTVMNDSGDTVSGGQKARIALARCFYQNSDVYILDDPTSSLDNTVSEMIMNSIKNDEFWSNRTFIISTNKLGLLKYLDRVIFIQDGEIIAFDTPQKITLLQEYAEIALGFEEEDEDELDLEEIDERTLTAAKKLTKFTQHTVNEDSIDEFEEEQKRKETFFNKEDRVEGEIKLSFTLKSLYAMGGLSIMIFMGVSTFISILCYLNLQNYFSDWGEALFQENNSQKARDLLFQNIIWSFIAIFIAFFRTGSYFMGGVFLGRRLHRNMTFRLLHANINNFLKRTPIGIILNRFSNDINNADNGLSDAFDKTTLLAVVVAATIIIVVAGAKSYLMLVPLFLYSLIAIFIRKRYMKASRELGRLQAITKSPVVGTSNACITGGALVRSFKKEDYFAQKNYRNINEHTKNAVMFTAVLQWFNSMNALMNLYIIMIPCYALFLLKLRNDYDPDSDEKKFSDTYLFLNNVIQFAGQFSTMLMFFSKIENSVISVERCRAYESIELENGYKTLEKDAKNFNPPKKNAKKILFKELNKEKNIFPSGGVEIVNVTARYPTSKKPVLEKINLKVEHGQKIGIVGRTGAGKSSFIKLLWRSLIPESGSIKIGGIEIEQIDLKSFRKEINVISQESNLFQGTLLSNITHKKLGLEEINALRNQLLILGFSNSKLRKRDLSFEVTVSGENLSESEKQIVCLVHALQHKSAKIVIMDEATAYIDEKVERQFQNIVWREFQESTVFIIAHRISNVMNCDRVLVFDKGKIIEDGNPKKLIKDERSAFHELWSKM